MPWKEAGEKDEAPDLGEILSKLKEKARVFRSNKFTPTKDKDEEHLLDASCPCESENKNHIVDVIVYCGACSNQFIKKTISHPYKVAAILAYGSSQFIEYVITDNRYPLAIEYGVIDTCISSYEKPVSYRIYGEKKTICLCAMEDTMNEISYLRYQVDEDGFLESFENNALNCQK